MTLEVIQGEPPYAVVHDPHTGSWVVINFETGRVADPARKWPTSESALAAIKEHRALDEERAEIARRFADEMRRIGETGAS